MNEWVSPKPGHTAGYSPKLDCFTYPGSVGEYLFESLIIFDPNYPTYRLHYPSVEVWVGNNLVRTIFDFSLFDLEGGIHLREYKDKETLALPTRSLQIPAQRIYARDNCLDYEIITDAWLKQNSTQIENCRLMRHHLSVHRKMDTGQLENKLEERLPLSRAKTLEQLATGLEISLDKAKAALYRLAIKGIAEGDFRDTPLSRKSLFWRKLNEHH